ncbi:mariner transposase [Trichonephila clavipes]|nr:mariner transposase [Trichonephila clavipes]
MAWKALLYIFCHWKEIIYYELLPYGQTLNSDLYCQQLDCLKLAIYQKRPELANRRGVVFHQENTRPHVCIDSPETLGASLGSFNTSVRYHGPGTKRLPAFHCITKLPE